MIFKYFLKFILFSSIFNTIEACVSNTGNGPVSTTSLPIITTTSVSTTTVTNPQSTTTATATTSTTTATPITCGALEVLKNDPTNSLDITQTETIQPDGSLLLTLGCTSPDPATTVTLFWNGGANGMTESTTNTLSADLKCGSNGRWELTQKDPAGADVTTEITQIECLFI